jgi:hypothetical protein
MPTCDAGNTECNRANQARVIVRWSQVVVSTYAQILALFFKDDSECPFNDLATILISNYFNVIDISQDALGIVLGVPSVHVVLAFMVFATGGYDWANTLEHNRRNHNSIILVLRNTGSKIPEFALNVDHHKCKQYAEHDDDTNPLIGLEPLKTICTVRMYKEIYEHRSSFDWMIDYEGNKIDEAEPNADSEAVKGESKAAEEGKKEKEEKKEESDSLLKSGGSTIGSDGQVLNPSENTNKGQSKVTPPTPPKEDLAKKKKETAATNNKPTDIEMGSYVIAGIISMIPLALPYICGVLILSFVTSVDAQPANYKFAMFVSALLSPAFPFLYMIMGKPFEFEFLYLVREVIGLGFGVPLSFVFEDRSLFSILTLLFLSIVLPLAELVLTCRNCGVKNVIGTKEKGISDRRMILFIIPILMHILAFFCSLEFNELKNLPAE